MSKIERYELLVAPSAMAISHQVNEHLNKGAILYGVSGYGGCCYFQAVVYPKHDDEKLTPR